MLFRSQTTSFAALIAAMGLAIGMAWAGLLANFAAGAFLLVLRPFKVGDFITAGGVTGTVHELGLFVTTFDTPEQALEIARERWRQYSGTRRIMLDRLIFVREDAQNCWVDLAPVPLGGTLVMP